MNIIFNRKKTLSHFAIALTAGALLTACAENASKPTARFSEDLSSRPSAPVDLVVSHVPAVVVADSTVDESIEVMPQPEKNTPIDNTQPVTEGKPAQQRFQFGFDKTELSAEDTAVLKQHAIYLIAHPQATLTITGHTDHNGPLAYNEFLSKKRAEAVAGVLIQAGVPESQLDIKARADSEPLLNISDARMNRRVELNYSELNMASQ